MSDRRAGPRHRPPTPSARRVCVPTAFAREAEVIPEADRPWRRLLRLDGEDSSHVDLRDAASIDFHYVRLLAHVADLAAPAGTPLRVLHLGGGGFTLPRYLAATRPGSRQIVAEHDGPLVALARAELGLVTGPELRVKVADARAVLDDRRPGALDLIVLDAFTGMDVPAQLTDAGFAVAAHRSLTRGGVLAANVIDAAPAEALEAHLAGAFARHAALGPRKVLSGRVGGNVILVASDRRLPLGALRARAQRGGVPIVVRSAGRSEPAVSG